MPTAADGMRHGQTALCSVSCLPMQGCQNRGARGPWSPPILDMGEGRVSFALPQPPQNLGDELYTILWKPVYTYIVNMVIYPQIDLNVHQMMSKFSKYSWGGQWAVILGAGP